MIFFFKKLLLFFCIFKKLIDLPLAGLGLSCVLRLSATAEKNTCAFSQICAWCVSSVLKKNLAADLKENTYDAEQKSVCFGEGNRMPEIQSSSPAAVA